MPDGGELTFEAHNFDIEPEFAPLYPDMKPGEYVLLAVADSGIGMPPEILTRVFEPFYTTKEAGKGTGLGLSMVYGFLKQSGGGVKIYSEVGLGTTVSLYFPRALPTPARAHSKDDGAPAAQILGGNERILIVEDNPNVQKVAVAVLATLGYETEQVTTAQAALSVLRERTFDVLFTDIVVPGSTNGIGLAREVRRSYPHMGIVLTSGFSSRLAAGTDLQLLDAEFVAKPYRKQDLAIAIRSALAQATRPSLLVEKTNIAPDIPSDQRHSATIPRA
jgi:CheY-like chemotaxis protein